MAITDKEEGVWELDQVYNKINQGDIWDYDGIPAWFTMGKSTNGDSGLNTTAGRSSPTQLPGTTWSKISSTSGRGFRGLKTDGTAWAWGYNNVGQLGINISVPAYSTAQRSSPCQIGTDNTWSDKFTASDGDTLWIKTDGTLWSWGYNSGGGLGLNTPFTGWPLPNRQGCFSSPTQVGTDDTWKDVVTSGVTLATKTNGTLWGWGNGTQGQLGLNTNGPSVRRSSPTQIGTGTDWDRLAGMAAGSCFAMKNDGSVWSWGYDQFGKLGQNTEGVGQSSPVQLPAGSSAWDQFTFGNAHILATKTNGTLWSWGYNPFGNLGLNDRGSAGSTSRSSPTQIPGTNWSQVASGYLTSAAIKTDGTLWTWGENEGGQLGLDDAGGAPQYLTCRSSPTQVGTDTTWSDPAATREEFFVKKLL